MDPVSILRNAIDLALAIKQIADDMSNNKTEGKELADKIQRLTPLMQTLQRRSAEDMNASEMSVSLQRLQVLLEDAASFLVQISPPKVTTGVIATIMSKVATAAKRVWSSASIAKAFGDLNNKFDHILLELSTKEMFKLDDSVSNYGTKMVADVKKVDEDLGVIKTALDTYHNETMLQFSQIARFIVESKNPDSFSQISSTQIQDFLLTVRQTSEQLHELAEEEDAALNSMLIAPSEQSAPTAPTKTSFAASARALLLLVDFVQLVWSKGDHGTVLGAGSFGTVYKCTYMDQPCAIKHFECLNKQKPTARDLHKIKREALIMQLASLHYNVIGFKGANVDAGVLIMELAQISLFDLLHCPESKDPLPLSAEQKGHFQGARWKIAIMMDIARALVFIHTHKILHRDLKTPNVLLVYDLNRVAVSGLPFVAKVSDFGLASAVGLSSSGRSAGAKGDKSAVGSAPYMAPELLDFEGDVLVYTPAADMYSFGILCNEMLTEREPWQGLQERHITRKVVDRNERPRAHVPTCPAEEVLVTSIIGTSTSSEACCLHQDATKRPTALSLCCGEQAMLSKALALCTNPLVAAPSVMEGMLKKIDEGLSMSVATSPVVASPTVAAPAVATLAVAVAAPAVAAHVVTAPAVAALVVAAPAVAAPAVAAPAVAAPAVTAPAVTAPAVTAPAVAAPAQGFATEDTSKQPKLRQAIGIHEKKSEKPTAMPPVSQASVMVGNESESVHILLSKLHNRFKGLAQCVVELAQLSQGERSPLSPALLLASQLASHQLIDGVSIFAAFNDFRYTVQDQIAKSNVAPTRHWSELVIQISDLFMSLEDIIQSLEGEILRGENMAKNLKHSALALKEVNGLRKLARGVLISYLCDIEHGSEPVDALPSSATSNFKARLSDISNTLVSDDPALPAFAMIIPTIAASKAYSDFDKIDPTCFRLFFLCSFTHNVALCGPQGQGYKINVSKQWLQDAAHVLRVGLLLFRLCMRSAAAVPCLPGSNRDYLNAALYLVQNPTKNSSPHLGELARLGVQLSEAQLVQAQNKKGTTIQESSRKAYEAIRDVLTKDGVDIASTCGLRQVTHKGKTAWILDKDDVEAQYRASV